MGFLVSSGIPLTLEHSPTSNLLPTEYHDLTHIYLCRLCNEGFGIIQDLFINALFRIL